MIIILLVYVDDIHVVSNADSAISQVKHVFHELFKIKDPGEAKCFLGMEIYKSS